MDVFFHWTCNCAVGTIPIRLDTNSGWLSGAPRLEGAIAIGELLRRFPQVRMKDPDMKPSYKGSFFLRGLVLLPLTLQ